jgi:hypothetical protein
VVDLLVELDQQELFHDVLVDHIDIITIDLAEDIMDIGIVLGIFVGGILLGGQDIGIVPGIIHQYMLEEVF